MSNVSDNFDIVDAVLSVTFELYAIDVTRATEFYIFTVDLDGIKHKTRKRATTEDTINAILKKYLR
jgi:hypothetical protein